MKVARISGSLGQLPVQGSVINFGDADVGTVVTAASGLAKTLAVGGGVGLATLIIAAIAGQKSLQRAATMPISVFARVQTSTRNFAGFCDTKSLDFSCDRQSFSVGLDRITHIDTAGVFSHGGYSIQLVDGSRYQKCVIHTEEFSLLTAAGRQSVPTRGQKIEQQSREQKYIETESSWFGLLKSDIEKTKVVYEKVNVEFAERFTIEGCTPEDVKEVRARLERLLHENIDSIKTTIGSEVFERYFRV